LTTAEPGHIITPFIIMATMASIPKLLKLLPVIKPAFKIYPEVLKSMGLESIAEI
jgi:hypothetical protein